MPLPVIPIERPFLPELLPAVITRFEQLLFDGIEIFEIGSGASTLWLAGHGARVTTVEHEPLWADEVQQALDDAGLSHMVTMIQVDRPQDVPLAIDTGFWDFGKIFYFDMVFIDCVSAYRQDAINRARPHVKPGGYLVADDSHWGGVHTALANIDWPREDISGMHTRKTGKVRFHQTSFLRRPDNERP